MEAKREGGQKREGKEGGGERKGKEARRGGRRE